MAFTPDVVALIFLTQFLAYTIKGLIGFGNPLISGPILAMKLDNVVITPGTLLLDCPINAYITWKNRENFRWRKILPLLLANLCGVIPGTLLLRFSLPWVIKTGLGVVVILLGLEMATRNNLRSHTGEGRLLLRLAVAVFSGICAGLFGINMFLTAYLQRTAKDYGEFKGSMCFLFFGENLFRLTTYLVIGGFFTREVLQFGLISVPAAALAMLTAGQLGTRLREERLQKGAIILFLLGGVSIVVKSLLFHT